ncbi:DUF397 domain-containing protein [Actinomadura rupiterrae]|uniref:DUF397 domain-containing protein n=1 Tax=Actinomadura rupiterrae TaxID=559627 RepID=UPI0020A2E778|nr:DUF397 domain-containing protein [Actinomadura rupiterrae]MCP2343150.1 hypothetical protein [Actinomadura rupiterrae]
MTEWRKSSYSGGGSSSGDCVELADLTSAVGLRDSKAPEVGHLSLSRESLTNLVEHIKTEGLVE